MFAVVELVTAVSVAPSDDLAEAADAKDIDIVDSVDGPPGNEAWAPGTTEDVDVPGGGAEARGIGCLVRPRNSSDEAGSALRDRR